MAARNTGLLLAGLLALAVLHAAVADPTTATMQQLVSGKDSPNCGELKAQCCLFSQNRCNSNDLACVPLDGPQSQRCHPCGGDSEPACDGGTPCESPDLQPFDTGRGFLTCLFTPGPVQQVQDSDVEDPNPRGPAKDKQKRINQEKAKKQDKLSRQSRGVGCGAAGSTVCSKARPLCLGGACVACGKVGQPCCPPDSGRAPCRTVGGKKAVALKCVPPATPNQNGVIEGGSGDLGVAQCQLPEEVAMRR